MPANASEQLSRCGQRKVNELGHGHQATHGQTAGTDNCGAQKVRLYPNYGAKSVPLP